MKQNYKTLLCIIIALIASFGVGFLSQYIQSDDIISRYPLLNKSSITPPNYIFPIAWSIIYLCTSISIGLLRAKKQKEAKIPLILFIIHLILNFLRCLVFFHLHNALGGLALIILLDLVVIYYMISTYTKNKISFFLTIPYISRLLLASYLNLFVVLYN